MVAALKLHCRRDLGWKSIWGEERAQGLTRLKLCLQRRHTDCLDKVRGVDGDHGKG